MTKLTLYQEAMYTEANLSSLLRALSPLDAGRAVIEDALKATQRLMERESSEKAKGAASLLIGHSEGDCEIHHGTDGTLLAKGNLKPGGWNRLIEFLKTDLGIEWQVD